MSWNPIQNPECPQADGDSIETLIIPRARDIAGRNLIDMIQTFIAQSGVFGERNHANPPRFAQGNRG